MITSLRSFLTVRIAVEPWTGQNVYGDATYGTSVSMPARISKKPKLVRADDGRETVAGSIAWVDPAFVTIGPKDRVTLPDGSTPPVLSIDRIPDERGRVCTRINFA